MSAQPWMKFYPSDWRSDPRLRMCSLGARGLWMEMLMLMHESVPYGHLIAGKHSPTDLQLSRLASVPESDIRPLISELIGAGALQQNADGILFSPILIEWNSRPERPPTSEWQIIRNSVFERDGYACRYCGDANSSLDCDHVIPVSRGGSSDIENLATACFRCNRSKGAKLLSEWIGRA